MTQYYVTYNKNTHPERIIGDDINEALATIAPKLQVGDEATILVEKPTGTFDNNFYPTTEKHKVLAVRTLDITSAGKRHVQVLVRDGVNVIYRRTKEYLDI